MCFSQIPLQLDKKQSKKVNKNESDLNNKIFLIDAL